MLPAPLPWQRLPLLTTYWDLSFSLFTINHGKKSLGSSHPNKDQKTPNQAE
ncbi:MAG: hypothetical protein ACI9YB_002840, partial [Halioglobus sp.]